MIKQSKILENDISDLIKPYLFSSTVEAIKRKVFNTQDFDYRVRYLGVIGPSLEYEKYYRILADMMNQYARTFHIVGQLGHSMKIELVTPMDSLKLEAAYMCYLAFTPESSKIIDILIKNKINTDFFLEGGIPHVASGLR